jgi:thiol-disulfide isomerase/thioredoxin
MLHRRSACVLVATAAIAVLGCDAKTPSSSAPTDEAESTSGIEKAAELGPRPMMIEFSRDYCTPCQVMKPWVTAIADENPNVDVLTLNVDRKRYEHIGSFFQVTAAPSLIFVRGDGHVVRRREGLRKKEQMTRALQELGWAD